MELTPLRSAALGLALVAVITLAVGHCGRLAEHLIHRYGLRPGLRERCRTYTFALLAGAIVMAVVSTALP